MTSILMRKRRFNDTEETQGRYMDKNQGMSKMVNNHKKLVEARNDSSPQSSDRA